ncbi:MAG: PAS domain S-box protein [Actinobacteria bacterium]|nr:PAS domain S-box protein [Actinomycetota bacterium]
MEAPALDRVARPPGTASPAAASTYRLLFDSSPDAVVAVDLDDIVTMWNRGAERMLGWTAEEVLGRPLPYVPPELEAERAELRRRMAAGEVLPQVRTQRLRRDGTRVDVSIAMAAVVGERGETAGYSAILRDVSEGRRQKRLIEDLLGVARSFSRALSREEVLEEVFAQSRRALGADGATFFRWEPARDRLLPERSFGRPPYVSRDGYALEDVPPLAWTLEEHRVLAVPDLDMIPREGAARTIPRGTRALLAVPFLLEEVRVGILVAGFRARRRIVDEDLALAQALGDEGAVALHRAELMDQLSQAVREERAEVERLEGIERIREEVLATVSHDFRAPLTAIKGFVSTLIRHDGDIDATERREILSVVDRQSTRLGRMIDNLLTVSEVEAGVHRRGEACRVEVRTMLEEMAEESRILSTRHEIEVAVDEPGLAVTVDEDYFRRVLANLIDNAIKYSPEGGTVTLAARGAGPRVRLTVADEGPGIPPELLGRLFSRFGRLEAPRSRATSTGLGLYIVRRLVEDMGGSVSVRSAPGEGTTFVIDLPGAEAVESTVVATAG